MTDVFYCDDDGTVTPETGLRFADATARYRCDVWLATLPDHVRHSPWATVPADINPCAELGLMLLDVLMNPATGTVSDPIVDWMTQYMDGLLSNPDAGTQLHHWRTPMLLELVQQPAAHGAGRDHGLVVHPAGSTVFTRLTAALQQQPHNHSNSIVFMAGGGFWFAHSSYDYATRTLVRYHRPRKPTHDV